MSVSEIVDATFRFYRANAATVVTLVVMLFAGPALLKLVTPARFAFLVDVIRNLVVTPLCEGAITAMVVASLERDTKLDVSEALASISDRSGSLIAVQIVTGIMIIIGLILLIVPGIIAAIWTAVVIPVVMIERPGFANAVSRSRALSRGQWGHIFGTILLSWGLTLLLVIGGGFVLGLLLLHAPERITKVLVDLLLAVAVPIPAIAIAFLYYDLRVRNESADLDAMVSALPANSSMA